VAPSKTAVTGPETTEQKAVRLRKQYPFESLTRRLEYEAGRAAGLAREGKEAKLTPETTQRLDQLEKSFAQEYRWSARAQSLQKLHSAQVKEFIERDGMGVSRMLVNPAPMFLDLPDAAPISLPEVGTASAAEEIGERVALPPKGAWEQVKGSRLPPVDFLGMFHQAGLFNFLSPAGFGYFKDREHVAGFRPHQFRGMPELREPVARGQVAAKTERWAVRRLELISLLKHEEPVVYVSEHLPRMDALHKAATRPLTEFETRAVKSLRQGEDLVTQATTEQIRLVGSVRAGKQCLACHEVKRGELLGAFSYKLQRSHK
jgi:hypothetical protein